MISKKRAFFISLMLVIASFFGSLAFNITVGNRVVITKSDYENLKELSSVIYLKNEIERNFYQEVDRDSLLLGMKRGLFEGLGDPYSQFYTKEEYDRLMESTSGSYVGVGLVVSPGEDGFITVIGPIEGTPADRAGIKPNDKILEVDNVKLSARELDIAVSMMKGEPDQKVVLTIQREGQPPFDVEIIRERIVLKSVNSEMMDDIGYIRISSFDEKTGAEFKENLNTIKENNPKGLIIDLRDNPGGYLDQVKEVADSIMGEGTIVYTQDRKGEKRFLKSDANGSLDIPLVILVNENSASASEILAGAVRDNAVGTLVGNTTFGKGLVQNLIPLRTGEGYKMTVAQYFTPNGEYIDGTGITPEHLIEDEDEQMEKAIEIINDKVQ